MANLEALDQQIESTQIELQSTLARLKGFDELQSSLDTATTGVREGGEALARLSEHLALTAQQLTDSLAEFRAAIEAMRAASPEALSLNVDRAVGATERTERASAEFQAQLKEEIADQRESLERRVHAVEGGLEQTRANIAQLGNALDERLDETLRAARGGRWTLVLVMATFLLLAAATALQFLPAARALVSAGAGG